MAEAPSFRAEAPKPRGIVEKVKQIRSPEQKRNRRIEKAAERSKRSVPEARITKMTADRQRAGRAMNLNEDQGFKLAVEQQKQAALKNGSLLGEVSGNTRQFSPTELADIESRAYQDFIKGNPNIDDYYRRNGLYFSKPDAKGNCAVDWQADPHMRAVDQRVQELRNGSSDTEANGVLDSFAKDCRDKAEMYAAAGHKGMKEALTRIGPRDVIATPGQTAPLEAAAVTKNIGEQLLITDIARYADLSTRAPADMTFADRNEMRQLQKAHEPQITAAKQLADEFDKDPTKILTPDELASLEKYKAFLKTPDATVATQQAVATGTPTTPDALKAQTEQQKRTLGSEAIGKLKDRNIDITQMTEAQVLHALKDGAILDPNGDKWIDNLDTQAYIRGAFAEQQMQQAEATLATIPQASIDEIVADSGLKKEDILGILLAALASGIISSIPKLP